VASVPESLGMWKVLTGSCKVDVMGCLTSPNFPAYYGTSQSCKVFVDREKAKPISAVTFSTEAKFDILAINGQRFSGTNGPKYLTPRGTIVWTSDSLDRSVGWRLCPLPPRQTPPPGYSGLWVASGPCSIGTTGCAVSPNYPQNYGHDQKCSIEAINMINPTITASSFLTEATYDYMQVNGQRLSGSSGPTNAIVSGPITWSSDYATAKSGWKICPVSRPAAQSTGATATGRSSNLGTVAPAARGGTRDTSGTMFMGLSIQYAALLGLVSVVAVLGSVWLCRRGRSTRAEPDKPWNQTTYGRKAGWDGL